MNKPIDIGNAKQLFIDDLIIEDMNSVTKIMNQPLKYQGNPVLWPTKPWEGRRTDLYTSVMCDSRDRIFKMWYVSKSRGYTVSYATSMDGILWEKPSLGMVDWGDDDSVVLQNNSLEGPQFDNANRDNNLIMIGAGNVNVIKDHRDPDPNRLYKSLFFHNKYRYVSIAFSPDGERWDLYKDNPVIERASDTHTLLGWDDAVGAYVAYPRPWMSDADGDRKIRVIGRSTSKDFTTWTDPEVVLEPDDQDPPGLEFYCMPVFKQSEMYIGLPWAYHAYPEETLGRQGATIDTQLAYSRDGIKWHRAGNRMPFIPMGPPGSIDSARVSPAQEPVLVGDELWFYYGSSDANHDDDERLGNISLAKLRLDGFVSVNADATGGSLVTKPLQCNGGELVINAEARGGAVSVAVLDKSGTQKDGFEMVNCAIFDGDSVRHRVSWRGSLSLDALSGTNIRLKFYLRSAKLYSFTLS
jgi:hypothetical protein